MSRGKTPAHLQGILDRCLQQQGNRHCCDCGREKPSWASFSLGLFLCMDCSGIHRAMGTHISKVRSVRLDIWDQKTVMFMTTVGNAKANAYFELKLPTHSNQRIHPGSSMRERDVFIRNKYERRVWYGHPSAAQEAAREEARAQAAAQAVLAAAPSAAATCAKQDARARYLARKQGISYKPNVAASAPVTPAASFFSNGNEDEEDEESHHQQQQPDSAKNLFAGMFVSPTSASSPANTPSPFDEQHNEKQQQQQQQQQQSEVSNFVPRARTVGASPWVQRRDNMNSPASPTMHATNKPVLSSTAAAAVAAVDILDMNAISNSDTNNVEAQDNVGTGFGFISMEQPVEPIATQSAPSLFSGLNLQQRQQPQQTSSSSAFGFLHAEENGGEEKREEGLAPPSTTFSFLDMPAPTEAESSSSLPASSFGFMAEPEPEPKPEQSSSSSSSFGFIASAPQPLQQVQQPVVSDPFADLLGEAEQAPVPTFGDLHIHVPPPQQQQQQQQQQPQPSAFGFL